MRLSIAPAHLCLSLRSSLELVLLFISGVSFPKPVEVVERIWHKILGIRRHWEYLGAGDVDVTGQFELLVVQNIVILI